MVGFTSRHGRTLGLIALVYFLFKFVLPALAALTPPGIDPKAVIAAADEHARADAAGCADACKGMACPAGWKTGRHAQDACRCICVRIESASETAWDIAKRKEREHEHAVKTTATEGGSSGGGTVPQAGAPVAHTPSDASAAASEPEDKRPINEGMPSTGADQSTTGQSSSTATIAAASASEADGAKAVS